MTGAGRGVGGMGIGDRVDSAGGDSSEAFSRKGAGDMSDGKNSGSDSRRAGGSRAWAWAAASGTGKGWYSGSDAMALMSVGFGSAGAGVGGRKVDSAGGDGRVSVGRGTWKTGAAGGNSGPSGAGFDDVNSTWRAAESSMTAATGMATGDLAGRGQSDRAGSREASAGGNSCRAAEARDGNKGAMGAAGSRAGCRAKDTEIGSNEAGRGTDVWAASCCG